MANQTEGRWPRYDSADGQADVTYVPLPFSDFDYSQLPDNYKLRTILSDIHDAITFQDHKVYSVYYEGSAPGLCGEAILLPDETYVLPAAGNVVYLQTPTCYPSGFPTRQDEISSYEFIAMHEIIHNLGAVDPRAPNTAGATPWHVDTSYTDIMYVSTNPSAPVSSKFLTPASGVLDFNRKNYYNPAGLPNGLTNIADSSFMISPKICNNRTEDCNPVFPPPPVPRPLLSRPPPIYASATGPDLPPPSKVSAARRISQDPRLLATMVASGAAIIVAAV